jgi:hypothetical protein
MRESFVNFLLEGLPSLFEYRYVGLKHNPLRLAKNLLRPSLTKCKFTISYF